jgi:tetratricopeptide (TPR) repeat protein
VKKGKRGETEEMVVAHELAHLFGAFHVRSHIRSLMGMDGIDIFDSQTRRAINLSRELDFRQGPLTILGLEENKRRQFTQLFDEGHVQGEANPLVLGLLVASDSLARQGNWEQALKLAEETQALDKRMNVAYRLRGDWHSINGRNKEAEQAYRQALEIQPQDPQALGGLGTVMMSQGRNQEASSIYSKALVGGNENWLVAKHNRALAYLNQGKLREAESELRELIKNNPKEVRVYVTLAAALGMQRKLEESVTILLQALQLDPNHAPAHANLGYSLAQMRKWDDAISEYRRALKLEPNDARTKVNLQNALSQRAKN